MIGKSIVFVLLLAPSILFANPTKDGESIEDRLDALEEIVVNAELETASCQMRNAWHFPCELYNYVTLARRYAGSMKKGRNSRKFEETLHGMLLTVEECIDGKKGYWSGNWGDVWIDPVPSVPECASESFEKMRAELEAAINGLL